MQGFKIVIRHQDGQIQDFNVHCSDIVRANQIASDFVVNNERASITITPIEEGKKDENNLCSRRA